ncbi:MAG TPA: hypothetical protein DG851_01170 [Lactobacillus acetotolerans]|jgi:hypothetical protein|nr:hypothetical protein [Lactobacillus acetotolerans]
MALVVVNMGITLWIVNHLSGIIFFAWTVLLVMNMYSNHKNKKSNKVLMNEIYESNDLNNQLLKMVKKYCDSTERKSTAQDNLLWESILILARRIHSLEDNSY